MKTLTFRSSRIAYYGPYPCETCGIDICRMGQAFGSNAFTYPSGPIYPNTEWHPHVCDPHNVYVNEARRAMVEILQKFPEAVVGRVGTLGYIIFATRGTSASGENNMVVISCFNTYADTPWGAWRSAFERLDKNYPTWELSPSEQQYVTFHTSGHIDEDPHPRILTPHNPCN